jgi:type 1 glutamine amidotransferase
MMRYLGPFIFWVALLPGASLAAEFPWMQSARAFLIDAYGPPFAVKLEYDAEALAETMARMNANTVRIATMGKYALIPGVRFTPHPELGKRDILAETVAACKRRGIRVVPYISTGHKLAWTMVTRDHPEYAHRSKPGGEPLRSHMFVGEDHGTICWNTPYRQAYLDLVERVVRDYDIDGIYFDTWFAGYFWGTNRMCYCDGCRNGFRKLTGLELPWREDGDYSTAERDAIRRYHGWLDEQLVETVREVRRLVKSHKNIPLIFNINHQVRVAAYDPRILEAMDAFLYERGHSILERAEGVSLARASGLGVWPYVGEYNNWPRVVHNGFDFQQQIFTTAMFGGASILAQPWGYVQHAAFRRFVEYPFGILKRNERDFTGATNYPYVAVVYGHQNPPGHAQRGTWWGTDARLSSLGAFAACLYGHVQVSSVSETLLDDLQKIRPYRVLYLADVTHLSEKRIQNIKAFVREGGGLVASYASSLFDASGNRQRRFALEELVRAAPIEPAGELAETLTSYRSMTGGPYDLYLAGRVRPSLADVTPLWHFLPVRALDGGEVWKDIVTGDGLRPILPGVIVSQYGKGRVVYCASGLESLFLQQNSSAVGDLLRSLVAKAAPEPPPFEIEAPAALVANLAVTGDTLVLHMTNWTGNKLERAGANEYYLAPVENVRVRLAAPKGKRVREVSLLVEAPYQKKGTGSTVEVRIPRIEAYQAVRVVLE